MVLVADSAEAADNGGNLLITITILIPGGRSGDSGTSRGNSVRGAVGEAYISPFREVSYESNFT